MTTPEFLCVICKFTVPLDDAIAPTARGTAICVGCYNREVADLKPMTKTLRKDLMETVNNAKNP